MIAYKNALLQKLLLVRALISDKYKINIDTMINHGKYMIILFSFSDNNIKTKKTVIRHPHN